MPIFDNMRGKAAAGQGAVISIDPLLENVLFCCSAEDGSLSTASGSYKDRPFDDDFYASITRRLKRLMENNPDMDVSRTSLVLPDRLFLTDLVTIPVIHRKAMQHSLSLAIESVYTDAAELNLMTYPVQQNKQSATFGIVGIRRKYLDGIKGAFAEAGITVGSTTFASNAMVNGAMALNSKLKGETCLLMDVKENCTRFAFVVRGCTMGCFDLPFGYGTLYKSRVAPEDSLFDHRAGELLVLNAKERARAKQLTMEGSKDGEGDASGAEVKSVRKLPKSLQRPTPQSKEEYIYENFRVFLKWALELIVSNREITSLAKLDTVYVNMPDEYRFLFDVVNKKHAGRGLTFAPMFPEGTDRLYTEKLDLYGGFFMGRFNEANTF